MSKVVEPNPGKIRVASETPERLREAVWVDRATVLAAEHQIEFLPHRAGQHTLLELALSMLAEHRDRRPVQSDGPAATGRLWCREPQLISDGHEGLADRETPSLEVNVLPPETKDFSSPHPGRSCEQPRGMEPVPFDRTEEGSELSCGPAPHFRTTGLTRSRWIREVSDVAVNSSPTQGVGEGLPNDSVYVPDGFHRQSSATVSLGRNEIPVHAVLDPPLGYRLQKPSET